MTPADRRFLSGVYAKVDQVTRRRVRAALTFLCLLGLIALGCAYALLSFYGIQADIMLLGLLGGAALVFLCAIDWLRLQPD